MKAACHHVYTMHNDISFDYFRIYVRGHKYTDKNSFLAQNNPLRSVSGHITSFLPFICLQDQLHFAAQHNVVRDSAENSELFFFIVMSSFL